MNCHNCGHELEFEGQECPKCKSKVLFLCDGISLAEQIKGKAKVDGIKKPVREFICGDDYSKSREKYVDKTRIIDSENDQYFEEVIDKQTGEIIHKCEEA